VLVLAVFEIVRHLFDHLGIVPSINLVARLEENLAESRLTNRVVLFVELVKAVKERAVGVHVQRVN
jgi:hypothetical protein